MTIEALLKAVPPPATPSEAFLGPWEPIEAELGTRLPQDYKDFVRVYGYGYFMEFLGINVPRTKNPYTRFEAEIHAVRGAFLPDEDDPRPLWPEPGGLIVFGGTDNGDYLFWLPRGAPEDWRVVVWSRGMSTFEVLDCDLTGFLAGLATGEVLPEEFPENMLPCDHLFQSHPPMSPA
ncbi:SMI1/KNR4 family protein [Phenylobacterium sp.]|uniref:SMI1/KNR4 family protein n=1 Tax=Phenylobacterium sp. TaxID=1871053 RepID=UPI00301DF610